VLKKVSSTSPISDWQVIYLAACVRTIGVSLDGVNTNQTKTPMAAITKNISSESVMANRLKNFFIGTSFYFCWTAEIIGQSVLDVRLAPDLIGTNRLALYCKRTVSPTCLPW